MNYRFATLSLLVASLLGGVARAQIPLCVQVQAPEAEREALTKLVHAELGHHPSHRPVEAGCRAHLAVELFSVAGQWQLTARIDQEIPVRYQVPSPKELSGKLKQALSLVLHNDPIYLSEDIAHYSAVKRAAHSVLVRGTNSYRVELFQDVIPIAGRDQVALAASAAFSVTRGSGHFQVYARVFAGGWPDEVIEANRVLRATAGASGGLTYELSALSATTFYASAGLGLRYMRFEGNLPGTASELVSIDVVRPTLDARIGARFFRLYDFEIDLFAGASLPWWPTDDVDVKLFGAHGAWTPAIQVGVGVGF